MTGSPSRPVGAWFSYLSFCLGRCGMAGALLLVAAAGWLAVQAWGSSGDALAESITRARADLQADPSAGPAPSGAQSFLAQLPAAERVPAFIDSVHRQARAANVAIERAEYRAPTLAAGQVLRLQVVLPLAGSFPDITRWLGVLMVQNPSAAIDELSLQRDPTAGAPVRARVVLSYYSRALP